MLVAGPIGKLRDQKAPNTALAFPQRVARNHAAARPVQQEAALYAEEVGCAVGVNKLERTAKWILSQPRRVQLARAMDRGAAQR